VNELNLQKTDEVGIPHANPLQVRPIYGCVHSNILSHVLDARNYETQLLNSLYPACAFIPQSFAFVSFNLEFGLKFGPCERHMSVEWKL